MGKKKREKIISWLQISDLHIFESSATEALHDSIKALFRDKVDFIVITGDLHQFEKKPSYGIGNYEKTIKELEKVMENIGLTDKRDVFMIPGNHDAAGFNKQKDVIAKIDREIGDNPDCYLSEVKELEKSFSVFQKFVRKFYGTEDFYQGNEIHNHIDSWRNKLEILHLNTAFVCDGDNKRRVVLNLMELSKLERLNPKIPMIAIGHHSCFCVHASQRPLMDYYLGKLGISAYLCGDAHRESEETLYLDGRVVPVIVCGKSAVQSGDNWSNVGMILYRWHYGTAEKNVEVCQYRWDMFRLTPAFSFVQSEELTRKDDRGGMPHRFFPVYIPKTTVRRNQRATTEKRFSLKKISMEAEQTVHSSLLFPWLNKNSASFLLLEGGLYINPVLKYKDENRDIGLGEFRRLHRTERNKKLWILGDAGIGKSTLLKMLYLSLREKKEAGLFITAGELFAKNMTEAAYYVEQLLTGKRECVSGFHLLIDGLDEIFASDVKGFRHFTEQVGRLKCEVWLGCRSQYFEQYAGETPFYRLEVKRWDKEQSASYVQKYFEKIRKTELFNEYKKQYENKEYVRSFAKNPFQLAMYLYLLENEPAGAESGLTAGQTKIENIYCLYSEFLLQWIRKERHRGTGAGEETENVWKELGEIARKLYDNENVVTDSTDTAVLGLLVTEKLDGDRKQVRMFWHRSFVEFLLGRAVIEAMKTGPDALILCLKRNNRSDVDAFVKAGFQSLGYEQKNIMAKNMIMAYEMSKSADLTGDEHFYVENQIVYYITRMAGMNPKPIEEFIRRIYPDEEKIIMRQGIAYGAANMGIFPIALEFARKMEPGSIEDITNRSWTLVFYGDMPGEDPLHYVDDHLAPWKHSREARLRRLKSGDKKSRAFRMFDLCILYGFFESRGWQDLSEDELKIIRECETEIPGYDNETTEFLKERKERLLCEYERRLDTQRERETKTAQEK